MSDAKRRAVDNYREVLNAAREFLEADEAWKKDPQSSPLRARALFRLGGLMGLGSRHWLEHWNPGTDFDGITRESIE